MRCEWGAGEAGPGRTPGRSGSALGEVAPSAQGMQREIWARGLSLVLRDLNRLCGALRAAWTARERRGGLGLGVAGNSGTMSAARWPPPPGWAHAVVGLSLWGAGRRLTSARADRLAQTERCKASSSEKNAHCAFPRGAVAKGAGGACEGRHPRNLQPPPPHRLGAQAPFLPRNGLQTNPDPRVLSLNQLHTQVPGSRTDPSVGRLRGSPGWEPLCPPRVPEPQGLGSGLSRGVQPLGP